MIPPSESPSPEQLLWARVGRGVLLGMALSALVGFALVSLGYPAMSFTGRIGVALFIGFWSGPFFGSVAGVGYHQFKIGRPACSPTLVLPATDVTIAVPLGRRYQHAI